METIIIKRNKEIIANQEGILSFDVIKSELTLSGINNLLIIDNKKSLELTLYLEQNSELTLNILEINKKAKANIYKIVQQGDSKLIINYSIVTTRPTDIEINNLLLNDNNVSELKISALSTKKGAVNIKVDGEDSAGTVNNQLLENIKILTDNNEINTIIPNIFVKSDQSVANHNATIGGINQESLGYLMSKGLSKEASRLLIKIGFITSNLKVDSEHMADIRNKILQSEVIS